MAGGGDVDDYVFAALDVDDLMIVEEGLPGAVLRFVFGGGAGAAGVFDVDVLDGGAEVGEAPGDVVVVADDDEGNAGEGDSGDVEVAGGWDSPPREQARRGPDLEVGLVPDAGDGVGEVHVVGEERLAGGGVGAGDDPVVGAGEAAFADWIAEGLLEGEEVLGRDGAELWIHSCDGTAKDGAPGFAACVEECGRAARDADISESRYGAPDLSGE